MAAENNLSSRSAVFLFNNVFLPPKLPKGDDTAGQEKFLVAFVRDALQDAAKFAAGANKLVLVEALRTIATFSHCHQLTGDDGILVVKGPRLEEHLSTLCMSGGVIPLYLPAQNSGLVIEKTEDASILVSAFELSPTNAKTMSTACYLPRTFPDCAIVIHKFADGALYTSLARTIATMSGQPVPGMRPKVMKAGKGADESRDTVSPVMVTELLMSALLPLGAPSTSTHRIQKNTRDDVHWDHSLLPWRRSPLWMLLRVLLQTMFDKHDKGSQQASTETYKNFMLYFLSRTASKLLASGLLNSDELFIMSAKLSRRLRKLGSHVTKYVSQAAVEAAQCIQTRLKLGQKEFVTASNEPRRLFRLANLKMSLDTRMVLPELDSYLDALNDHKDNAGKGNFTVPWMLARFTAHSLPIISRGVVHSNAKLFQLLAIETWMEKNLQEWVHAVSDGERRDTICSLHSFFKEYHEAARIGYGNNPEALSIMYLILLELWVAMDTLAVGGDNLLRHYNPGIPAGLFQSFLLPKRSQMERLCCAEKYVHDRGVAATLQNTEIFTNFGHRNSYAVKYFEKSQALQQLKIEIENCSQLQRDIKLDELRREKQMYNELTAKSERIECEREAPLFGEARVYCECCDLKQKANSMTINVQEWALPTNEGEAKAVVFELQIPQNFGYWRSATKYFLVDVLREKYTRERNHEDRETYGDLKAHADLRQHMRNIGGAELSMLIYSKTKAHVVTHRKFYNVSSATEDLVCVPCGLHYAYYDTTQKRYMDRLETSSTVSEECMYKIPHKFRSLQKFLFQPYTEPEGLPPNTVLASQNGCPAELSISTFRALCSLSYGERILWINILRQIAAPAFDLKTSETGFFVLQGINQAGTPNSDSFLRTKHEIGQDNRFAKTLLEQMEARVDGLCQNWQAAEAYGVITALACRLLTLNGSVHQEADRLLSKVQKITFGWVKELSNRTQDCNDHLKDRALRIALICASSFDVDTLHLRSMLSDSGRLSIFLQCSVVIQEGHQVLKELLSQTPPCLETLRFRRWQSLNYRCYSFISEAVIVDGNRGLDEAVVASWNGYRPSGKNWRILSEQNPDWLYTTSSNNGDVTLDNEHNIQLVHFHMLTGLLLVNGDPVNRLPATYEADPLYAVLFGDAQIEVVPNNAPGLTFSGKRYWKDQQLDFGWAQGHMQVRASKSDKKETKKELGETSLSAQDFTATKTSFQLLPFHLFQNGSFPTNFVDDYVHWYNTNDRTVEFTRKSCPWNHDSDEIWKLKRLSNDNVWTLVHRKTDSRLINAKSMTGTVLADIFSPLEIAGHIHLQCRSSDSRVDIYLPRLRLHFWLNEKETLIHSRQYRGMIVDEKQVIDSLVGLRNRLVLKSFRRSSFSSRTLLIPDGDVSHCVSNSDFQNVVLNGQSGSVDARSKRSGSRHISVSIDSETSKKVMAFRVNVEMNALSPYDDTLHSKLFIAYLHALTSFTIVDGLTLRTGTEQALSILRSAAARSFEQLSSTDVELLVKIRQLSPELKWYPTHLQDMSQVTWDSHLGFLAQDVQFATEVDEMLSQAQKLAFLYPDSPHLLPKAIAVEPINTHLNRRHLLRSANFRVCGFGAEMRDLLRQEKADSDSGRGRGLNQSSRALRSFGIAKQVVEGSGVLSMPFPSHLAKHIITFLTAAETVSNSRDPDVQEIHPIRYDKLWVEPEEFCNKLGKHWLALVRKLSRHSASVNRFDLAIFLATMAFEEKNDFSVIQLLAILWIENGRVKNTHLGKVDGGSFRLKEGPCVVISKLSQFVDQAVLHFNQCPEAQLTIMHGESKNEYRSRRSNLWKSNKAAAKAAIIRKFRTQWPTVSPSLSDLSASYRNYHNIETVLKRTIEQYVSWHNNKRFVEYIAQLLDKIPERHVSALKIPRCALYGAPSSTAPSPGYGYLRIKEMFSNPAPACNTLSTPSISNLSALFIMGSDRKETFRLGAVLDGLTKLACRSHETEYIDALQKSQIALKDTLEWPMVLREKADLTANLIDKYFQFWNEFVPQFQDIITAALWTNQCVWDKIHGPRVSRAFLLSQLRKTTFDTISEGWKSAIIGFGTSITSFQRAKRLIISRGNHQALLRELQHEGHENWEPKKHPEWLLLEIENEILIRPVQHDIAQLVLISRPEDTNSHNAVMQLNMGEGKSSVIVPMACSALADGSQLTRVIVAKPQAPQMYQMLISTLGGHLGRRVLRLPFSRSVPMKDESASVLFKMLKECCKRGDVLLVQPEHILSLQLACIERTIAGEYQLSSNLLRTHHLFQQMARDIVDESDENFSVRFELVYTMGLQRKIDFAPRRWTLVQEVLEIFLRRIKDKSGIPTAVEMHESPNPDAFPRCRILRSAMGDQLILEIARDIVNKGLREFPIAWQLKSVRDAVFVYITKLQLSSNEIEIIESNQETGFFTDSVRPTLFMLRGLLAHRVLLFPFEQKQWRVDFGLSLDRVPHTRLAVPFRAKDSPSPRSEFSHHDVLTIMTSLSYYYDGLSEEDFWLSLQHLVRHQEAESVYTHWVQNVGCDIIPQTFQTLTGVNLDDKKTCIEKLFPKIRYSKTVIDYFLSNIVFAKEMAEFPKQLSVSGWDLGEKKTLRTTGFSGTIDSRHTLPLDVTQLDLTAQEHTNARVLECVLQPENRVVLLSEAERSTSSISDAERLLRLVVGMRNPSVRVILDVAALVLELDNIGVAREWLRQTAMEDPAPQAVVFCDIDDNLCVLDRGERVERLSVSPYASQLDQCLVFLDQAHTRGINLILPGGYSAAVTLGPGVTKDRLVQGCMRMRQLGKGQSVVFCVPDEIVDKMKEAGIIDANVDKNHAEKSKAETFHYQIGLKEVIMWVITETWVDTRRSLPLWAVQGKRHLKNKIAWNGAFDDKNLVLNKTLAENFLEDEAQTIEKRYRPRPADDDTPGSLTAEFEELTLSPIGHINDDYGQKIVARCKKFNTHSLKSAALQEEQERELAPEAEEQRQVERPAATKPAEHFFHPAIEELVVRGTISPALHEDACSRAFESLKDTSAAQGITTFDSWPGQLRVTRDFARTVDRSKLTLKDDLLDSFQRDVHWIMTYPRTVGHGESDIQIMLVLSPFEANILIPMLNDKSYASLHVYSTRPSLAFRPLDHLDLYTLPAPVLQPSTCPPLRITAELNLFAGQLYFRMLSEYVETCSFLGLAWEQDDSVRKQPDGFIVRPLTTGRSAESRFLTSPVPFFRILMMKIRRNCKSIETTHIGKMLDGIPLKQEDFVEEDSE